MKISRKELRKIISERIKPNVPKIPDDATQMNLDDLARDPYTAEMSDVAAQGFEFPEDRSYSSELSHYDTAHVGLPGIAAGNERRANDIVDKYDRDIYDSGLSDFLGKELEEKDPVGFDNLLFQLAADAYRHSENYAQRSPFQYLNEDDGINLIKYILEQRV